MPSSVATGSERGGRAGLWLSKLVKSIQSRLVSARNKSPATELGTGDDKHSTARGQAGASITGAVSVARAPSRTGVLYLKFSFR